MKERPRLGHVTQSGEASGVSVDMPEVYPVDEQDETARRATALSSARSVYRNAEGDIHGAVHLHARVSSLNGAEASGAAIWPRSSKLDEAEALRLLQACEELRRELLEYFAGSKLDMIERWPEGFDPEGLVEPSYPGYGVIAGRDYVARLALSMLDGTFDVAAARDDPIQIMGQRVVSGVHRYIALQLVGALDHASMSVVGEIRWLD